MSRQPMSEETKTKIKASREANKAANGGAKRATLDDQIAAAQALADSGDAFAQSLMPVVDVLRELLKQHKQDAKTDARKLRKTLSVLK